MKSPTYQGGGRRTQETLPVTSKRRRRAWGSGAASPVTKERTRKFPNADVPGEAPSMAANALPASPALLMDRVTVPPLLLPPPASSPQGTLHVANRALFYKWAAEV